MIMKDKKDLRPVLLKFGVALALSLGGILYSFLRTKRIRPSQPPPSARPSDSGNQVGSEGEVAGNGNNEEHEDLCCPTDNSVSGHSPSGRSSGDKDGFLLPQFNELVKDFDLAATKACSAPKKDVETLTSDTESPRGHKVDKRDDREQEIKSLRNLVMILKERERALEIQLLEYYGLKEQETAVMELHNQLKINNMEAKFFSLKIESLQADNRRLESQVTDYMKIVADLEAARAKIKLLKKKFRTGAEQNKEHILALQQRVSNLQEQEKMAGGNNEDIQQMLQKLKDLEEEVEELRKSNYNLQLENSDLGRRLDYAQIIATSVFEDEESEAIKEESQRLQKQNEHLTKEVERLQEDRCRDVEELVYLRWINACLRYELRNYQPGPGKTVARDLSKSLSPKSEEKAKQLILEYANKECVGGKGTNSTQFDSDSTSSQASYFTDSGDLDDSSVDNSSTSKTNTPNGKKIFGKLIKLLRGNGHRDRHLNRSSSLELPASMEVVPKGTDKSPSNKSRASSLSSSRQSSESSSRRSADSSLRISLESSSRRSLESSRLSWDLNNSPSFQRSKTEKVNNTSDSEGGQKNSDDAGSSSVDKKSVSISERDADALQDNKLNKGVKMDERYELLQYAEDLIDTHGKKSPKFCRRSASVNSFRSV